MFGFHPANLAFRFLLEIAALVAIGLGAYRFASGFTAWLLAFGLPLVAAVAWGAFNVPGDASRSGKAPVQVDGAVRIGLEFLIFAAAVLLIWFVSTAAAVTLGIGVGIHYLLSIDRLRWLLTN